MMNLSILEFMGISHSALEVSTLLKVMAKRYAFTVS
jgi:hypothetical protein